MPPPRRVGLRARLGRVKRRLAGLAPPRYGSQAWLRREGIVVLGRHSYGEPCVRWFDGDTARVSIGKWCSMAAEVEIMPGGNHRLDAVTTYPIRRRLGLEGTQQAGEQWSADDVVSKGDVVIGNDVWIGRGAKILGGVTIGDGAVVAAWSVVTRSVAPYTIAAGVPARTVRQRFSTEIVESLLRIRWWDWDDALVVERVDQLTGNDLLTFTRTYDPSSESAQTLDETMRERA